MKRLAMTGVCATIVVLTLFVAFRQNAPAEESLEERVSALETQVAVLQTEVARNNTNSQIDQPGGNRTTPTPAAKNHDIEVTVDLTGPDHIDMAGARNKCRGNGGYDDIAEGMYIRVLDASGNVIGTAIADDSERISTGRCRIYASVENVPEVDFYQFDIAGRGAPSYSLQDMKEMNWTIALSIGD